MKWRSPLPARRRRLISMMSPALSQRGSFRKAGEDLGEAALGELDRLGRRDRARVRIGDRLHLGCGLLLRGVHRAVSNEPPRGPILTLSLLVDSPGWQNSASHYFRTGAPKRGGRP